MALSGRIGSPGRGKGGLCLQPLVVLGLAPGAVGHLPLELAAGGVDVVAARAPHRRDHAGAVEQLLEAADGFLVRTLERSEEHTSGLQSLMRISYAVFCLKKKKKKKKQLII